MKKTLVLIAAIALALQGLAQNCYWVFLVDKEGTTFDPYAYFDAKAIERYRLNDADLYDISNYPLRQSYVDRVTALAQEEVGTSRWLNAVAVMATPEQMAQIEKLECVKGSSLIASQMEMAHCRQTARMEKQAARANDVLDGMPKMSDQLLRMQGSLFRSKGIDGKGVRVAVFDGGFPAVNTHQAFKHLRDNNQIVATWNFCNKKENVYGWSTHGTMVLSCIAGILNGHQLGLATGATFLLARTEVEPEPYKEEVWWQQAMEWADKNGADVINSSLGYGKDRHFTYEMDGRSTVAHAANMAARKGILVCNSAGNEGNDKTWKTIITPADADSVLTVGGINADLYSYGHIYFSSYGPTADGRLKPNVCNFGQASVADPKGNDKMSEVFGTSFSSPLTAGFVACAKQAKPGLTAMQLKAEVERSGDLYPYFDYAFGYGVPQASYFLTGKEMPEGATFVLEDSGEYLYVRPTGVRAKRTPFNNEANEAAAKKSEDHVFMKLTDSNGIIQKYVSLALSRFDDNHVVSISKHGLAGMKLTVFFDGYAKDYRLPDDYAATLLASGTEEEFYYAVQDSMGRMSYAFVERINRSLSDNKTRPLGDKYFI
ncbi:MAG: S8 family serine peptidase, partial [Bacteroidales bacterium]|nr:S8 family serine peptidase [Bacteroidales bacterium]